MKDYGMSFRLLRKERGFTLKTMSEGIISYSYLSKFEKGESDITFRNFVLLIERLNMTLDEFLFFNHVRTTHYAELFQAISFAYEKNDLVVLKQYYEQEKALYKKTKVVYHKCNFIMIATIIKDIDTSFFISNKNINFLVDYIVNCSFWTTYEVSVLGNTLPLFPEDLLVILLNEVKKRIKQYTVSQKNVRDLIALIENACIIFLRKKKVKEALSLSDFLDDFLEFSYFLEKTRKLFIDGIIFIHQGEINLGTELAKQAISIIRVMDTNFANDHEAELRYFLESIK